MCGFGAWQFYPCRLWTALKFLPACRVGMAAQDAVMQRMPPTRINTDPAQKRPLWGGKDNDKNQRFDKKSVNDFRLDYGRQK